MSKLKKLISQLNNQEVRHIYKNLIDTDATKSAELLHLFKEGVLEDSKIKKVLDVSNNAYYTLRSRLNDKIETFILEKTENPRTELLKQVASIKDLIYTKNRIVSLATLHKLEKDLLSHNLHYELCEVYRALKRLHIRDEKYSLYSHNYNQQLTLIHAISLAEDLYASYFNIFGEYLLETTDLNKLKLTTTLSELSKLSKKHDSKRLLLLYLCVKSFNNAFFKEISLENALSDIKEAKDIIDTHLNDSLYFQLNIVIDYHLCLLYYFHKHPLLEEKVTHFRKKITNEHIGFYYNTYPCFVLNIFNDLNIKLKDLPDINDAQEDALMQSNQIAYQLAQLIKKTDEKNAIDLIHDYLEKKTFKHFDKVDLDYKIILICLLWNRKKLDGIDSNIKGIQRLIRNLGKDEVEHSGAVLKMLVSISSKIDQDKKMHKITQAREQLQKVSFPKYSPMEMIGKTFFENLRNQ